MDDSLAIASFDEPGLARWRVQQGHRVVQAGGHYWRVHRGFFRPLHDLARLPADELSRNPRGSWGFCAALRDEDARRADAALPVHAVLDLASYDESRLVEKRRRDLRRCEKRLELVLLERLDWFSEWGWQIFRSSAERTGRHLQVGRGCYLDNAERLVADAHRLAFGAVIEGQLVGYLETYAVGEVAYCDEICLGQEALRLNAAAFLVFQVAQLFRRDGRFSAVSAGAHLPEKPGITEFKRRLGMPVVMIPARCSMPPPVRSYLMHTRPLAYYRLTGSPPVVAPRRLAEEG